MANESTSLAEHEAPRDDIETSASPSTLPPEDCECEDSPSSWEGLFWNALRLVSSGLTWNTREDTSAIVQRRDCSATMDTTPTNDLEQFLSAVKVLERDVRLNPWTKTSSFTEIPICKQQETWDCGESLCGSCFSFVAVPASHDVLIPCLTPSHSMHHQFLGHLRGSLFTDDSSVVKRRREC